MPSQASDCRPEFESKHIHLNIRRADGLAVPVQMLSIQVYTPKVDPSTSWQPQVVMLAFSQPTWSMSSAKALRVPIGQLVLANPTKLLFPPTRLHSAHKRWDIWAEPRSLWILVGEDGLYYLITQREEGNHVDWTLFPSLDPGVARGSHKALCLVVGKQVADRLAADTQRKLSLNYPDI